MNKQRCFIIFHILKNYLSFCIYDNFYWYLVSERLKSNIQDALNAEILPIKYRIFYVLQRTKICQIQDLINF
jgi:hypothetical protein